MALNKQSVAVNFAQGIDTKSDPWQIPVGKFFDLENSVFTKQGLLTKRNGFAELITLPVPPDYIATFNGGLVGFGTKVENYSSGLMNWATNGDYYPVNMSTAVLARTNGDVIAVDTAISPNKLLCTVYSVRYFQTNTTNPIGYLFTVSDLTTGLTLIPPTTITGTFENIPASLRVFVLNGDFVILYINETNVGLNEGVVNYFTVNYTTLAVGAVTPLTGTIGITTNNPIDGIVYNNTLYFAYNNNPSGIFIQTLSSSFVIGTPVVVTGSDEANYLSVTSDTSVPAIWVSYNGGVNNVYSAAFTPTPTPAPILAATPVFTTFSEPLLQITSYSVGETLTVYATIDHTYTYNSAEAPYIEQNTITIGGVTGTQSTFAKTVQVASKVFLVNGNPYLVGDYIGTTSTTASNSIYFLFSAKGEIVAQFAIDQGQPSTPILELPSVTVIGSLAYVPYMLLGGEPPLLGANQMTFNFSPSATITSVEIGNNLMVSGGFLWGYDGTVLTENGFFVYPTNVVATGSATSGSMSPQEYLYEALYTWTDNQGNVFRSTMSIPVSVTLTSDTSVTINIPTLQLTYKTNVQIDIYRASTAQPQYYLVDYPISVFNDPTVDFITYTDTSSDATILANGIIPYDTGGVQEDTAGPGTSILTIWDERLWLVQAEDPNQLWFSKQVINDTPVEMAALFTFYIATVEGSEGASGSVTALHPMDDKLIVFHANDIAYINGAGPDNTGVNRTYSEPITITGTVGCISPNSIVMTPSGLFFQSSKGIWVLGRSLETQYVGAPVENYTQYNTNTQTQPLVISAVVIPNTTQIRFMLNTGVTLMYDYLFQQWSSFTGITAQSSAIYQGLHTFIDQSHNVLQETPGTYADISNPVNMRVQTGWINVAGLQGYERSYYFYLLGQWFSSHTLQIQVAYDYNPTIEQTFIITPAQQNVAAGPPPPIFPLGSVEQWRVFLKEQKCQAFQLTITEMDTAPGQGLTISGLNMVIGTKKGYPVRRQNLSVG